MGSDLDIEETANVGDAVDVNMEVDEDYTENGEEGEQENEDELNNMDPAMDIDIDEDEEELEDEDNEEEYTPIEGINNQNDENNEEDEESNKNNSDNNNSKSRNSKANKSSLTGKRGRPRLKEVDELPEDYEIFEDEIITPDDPKGDLKIDAMGNLKGGRKFRVKSFKLPGKGDKQYAISTDVARSVGYRDSYFLFQRHLRLFRVTLTEEMKMELIATGILPTQFKTRQAYLVAVRSTFKEFGAKVIVNGKQIIDDYYEDAARTAGAVEGAPVSLNTEFYSTPTSSTPALIDKQRNLTVLVSNNVVSDVEISWMHDHAIKTRQFESMMLFDRSEALKGKVQRDVYTGLNFVPDFTQPTRAHWEKISEGSNNMTVETILIGNNVQKTGLASVPLEIFDDCVDDETRAAILQQQEYEQV